MCYQSGRLRRSCLAECFWLPGRIARVALTRRPAPRFEQLHRPARGTSPGIEPEQRSQPLAQESFPLDPADSIALALRTDHVRSLRKVTDGWRTDHHIPNRLMNRPKIVSRTELSPLKGNRR